MRNIDFELERFDNPMPLRFIGTFGRGGRGPAPLGRGGGTQLGNKTQNKQRPK